MAGVTGLEPATSGVTGRRSNQSELHPQQVLCEALPYGSFYTVSSLPQKPEMVGGDGIEPPTLSV